MFSIEQITVTADGCGETLDSDINLNAVGLGTASATGESSSVTSTGDE